MKRITTLFFVAVVLALMPRQARADSTTTNLGLDIIDINSTNWGPKINNNMSLIDSLVGGLGVAQHWTNTNTYDGTVIFNSSFTSNGKFTYRGTTTNDSALSGYAGEELISTRARNAVSLTNATAANVLSASLDIPAGDYDVDFMEDFTTGASAVTSFLTAGVNTVSATIPSSSNYGISSSGGVVAVVNSINMGANTDHTIVCPPFRVSVSGTTHLFLVAQANFSAGTVGVGGQLRARRVR